MHKGHRFPAGARLVAARIHGRTARPMQKTQARGCLFQPHQKCLCSNLAQEQGRLLRVPFWGSTAGLLSLVVVQPCDMGHFNGFCSALATVIDPVPCTVELSVETLAPVREQQMLEALAGGQAWAKAWIRLRLLPGVGAVIFGQKCSATLKERLVWCDAVIRSSEFAAAMAPFPVLQNLVFSGCLTCTGYCVPLEQAFPSVQHVHARLAPHYPTASGALVTALAPIAHKLLSLTIECDPPQPQQNSLAGRPLSLGRQTALSCTASLPFVEGGTLLHAAVSGTTSALPRQFEATGVLSISMGQELASAILAGRAPVPDLLLCQEACMLLPPFPLVTLQEAIDAVTLVVRAMRRLRKLTVDTRFLPCLAGLLPETLRHLVLVGDPDLDLEAIRAQLSLKTVTPPFNTDAAGIRRMARDLPAGCALVCNSWDLANGQPPVGAMPRALQLSLASCSDPGTVSFHPTEWTRGVAQLILKFPLGSVFVARGAGLARVFPSVSQIAVRVDGPCIDQAEFDTVRSLCVALGPRLRSVSGLVERRFAALCDPVLCQACPWLK